MLCVVYCEGQVTRLSDRVMTTFRSGTLKTYFIPVTNPDIFETIPEYPQVQKLYNSFLIDTREAAIGDAFDIVSSHAAPPTICKRSEPNSRGEKIAWALEFKQMSSFDDFAHRYNIIRDKTSYDVYFYEMIPHSWAFLMAKKHAENSGKPDVVKPLLAWVEDAISKEDLECLIQSYTKYLELPVPEEYLYVL